MERRDEYDVVVVGAGPAGLQFAREVASRSDYAVAVLERNDRLRDNDKSTGGTFPEVVEGYDLPDEVVMAEADAVAFEGPNARSRHAMRSHVLDFPALLEFLGEEAAAAGAEIRTGTTVTAPIVEEGTVRGVRYRDADGESEADGEGEAGGEDEADDEGDVDGEGEVRAGITVDASGPSAALTSRLGLFETDAAQRGVALEFEIEGAYDTHDALLFRFDHDAAPGGYAWTFPAGEDAFKAGVCWLDEFHAARADGDSLHDHVERWVASDPRWRADRVRAKHAGEGVWADATARRVADGFLAVGDAISSINPLFGEGIRPGMQSARMAADAALDALDAGDPSASRLRSYERRWNEARGREWKLQRIVGELLYDFDAGQQDAFVEQVDDLSTEAAERLRQYRPGLRTLAKLYPFRLEDLRKVPRLVGYL